VNWPGELVDHIIEHRNPATGCPYEWEFHRQGENLQVGMKGCLVLNDVVTKLAFCLSGAGITQLVALGVQNLIDDGKLIELFADWADERFTLQAFYPSRHLPAEIVWSFVGFLQDAFAKPHCPWNKRRRAPSDARRKSRGEGRHFTRPQ
jgi:DNA-binding transcriptional LysR family regulator